MNRYFKKEKDQQADICGFLISIKNKKKLFSSSAASESLSTAMVTTLFAASIKVTYKLGQKEMSIPD